MKAVIVGGGPVGCLVARELRKRTFEVHVFERGPDPRRQQAGRGHSFNLTLTLRGLSALDGPLQARLYAQGLALWQRVIHPVAGPRSHQPYGTLPQHHLLSIPRSALHATLLDEAERAGVRVRFGHECLRVDPRRARATFVAGNSLFDEEADVLVGCDGTHSVVRQELSRHGARMDLHQEHLAHGYVELCMPPGRGGVHCLVSRDTEGAEQGLHVWPRGDFMLIAQPNRDASYTATLFMPLTPTAPGRPALQALGSGEAAQAFFAQHFADALPHLPRLAQDLRAGPPSSLRTVRCGPFHLGRTVLLGDAAHTLVPFYGQGINCSFEDVQVLMELLEESLPHAAPHVALPQALARFSAARQAPGDAIAELSLANLQELSAHTGERRYQARRALERELHRRCPEAFTPLYARVAFSRVPYDEVLRRHAQERAVLDALCERHDVLEEPEKLVEAFCAQLQAGPTRGAA